MKLPSVSGLRDGNVALTFALLLPVLLGAAGAAVDFAHYSSVRAELQEIADAAALAGAREYLTLRSAGTIAEDRAEHAALSQFLRSGDLRKAEALATADDSASTVSIAASFSYRPTLFVALFKTPLEVAVAATAQASGGANICVIGLGDSGGDVVALSGNAKLSGTDCAVYSNSKDPKGLSAKGSGALESAFTCSSGGYDGDYRHFTPLPLTDCPERDDPLAERPEPRTGPCQHTRVTHQDYVGRLSPGVYCDGVVISGDSIVTLDPGIYIFKDGPLEVKGASKIEGDGVGFFFTGFDAGIKFEDKSSISLAAPETGDMAGILIWQSRAAFGVRNFEVSSNFVDRLVGTIYLPDAEFTASATSDIAEDSAYTAIIAKRIRLDKNTRLVLNADYAQTSVPVPAGIANAGGAVFLRE